MFPGETGSSMSFIEDPVSSEPDIKRKLPKFNIYYLSVYKNIYNRRMCNLWFYEEDGKKKFHRTDGPAYRSFADGEHTWYEYWEYGVNIDSGWEY